MRDAARKVSICFILSGSFSKPGHPLNLVPFCENVIFYSLEFVCIYLDFHGINAKCKFIDISNANVPVKSKLKHPPRERPRAFDVFSCQGGREFD